MDFIVHVIEFSSKHPILVGVWLLLAILLIMHELKKGGKTINNQELTTLFNKDAALLVDLRDAKNFSQGHIKGSINIPYATLQKSIETINLKAKDKTIIFIDAMGQHAASAIKQYRSNNKNTSQSLVRLRGGIESWKNDRLLLTK